MTKKSKDPLGTIIDAFTGKPKRRKKTTTHKTTVVRTKIVEKQVVVKHCVKCGQTIPEKAQFCEKCGEKQSKTAAKKSMKCEKCDRDIAQGAVYCEFCGTKQSS